MSNVIVTVTPGTNTVQVAPSIAVATGPGVPTGGTVGQVLTKQSSDPRDTAWQDPFELDITALAAEWNDAGEDYVGIGLDVTDTASGAGSKLLDLKVDGTIMSSIDKAGLGYFAGGLQVGDEGLFVVGNNGKVSFKADNSFFHGGLDGQGFQFTFDATTIRGRNGQELHVGGNTGVRITQGLLTFGSGIDLQLHRDAADTLAQRRGTNPQTQRWYGSYTDASNNEGFEIVTQAGDTLLRSFANGTGTRRDLTLAASSSAWVEIDGRALSFVYDLDQVAGIGNWFKGSNKTGAAIGASSGLYFNSGDTLSSGSFDTGLARDSAGVLKVTDGGAGLGDLVAGKFIGPSSRVVFDGFKLFSGGFATSRAGIEFTNTGGFPSSGNAVEANIYAYALGLHISNSADALSLQRGTNPQTFLGYNTWTDASNWERWFMRWASNVLEIGTEAAGTGGNRGMLINAAGRLALVRLGQTYDQVDIESGGLKTTAARIDMVNLPTSDPAVAGRLWNDGGTLKVSAG